MYIYLDSLCLMLHQATLATRSLSYICNKNNKNKIILCYLQQDASDSTRIYIEVGKGDSIHMAIYFHAAAAY